MLLTDEVRARIFGPDAALGSASDAMGRDMRDSERTPYPDEDDSDG